MNILIKIDRVIEKIQTLICFVLFVFILTLGSIQVFGRYIYALSIPWTEELMRFMAIWLAMIGSSLTIRVDEHVSVDLLIGYMNNNKIKATLFVIARLICVVFLLMFLPASIKLILKATSSMATSLPLPYSYIYAGVPIGIVMMLLSYASTIPKYAKEYLKGER